MTSEYLGLALATIKFGGRAKALFGTISDIAAICGAIGHFTRKPSTEAFENRSRLEMALTQAEALQVLLLHECSKLCL